MRGGTVGELITDGQEVDAGSIMAGELRVSALAEHQKQGLVLFPLPGPWGPPGLPCRGPALGVNLSSGPGDRG